MEKSTASGILGAVLGAVATLGLTSVFSDESNDFSFSDSTTDYQRGYLCGVVSTRLEFSEALRYGSSADEKAELQDLKNTIQQFDCTQP